MAALLVAACSSNSPDQTTTPPATTFTVGPHDIWAGSTVTIRSSAFHGAIDTTGVAQFNGTSLVLHRVDDTTLSVNLPPSTMAGSYPLSLQFAAVVKTLDPITVYGYADSTSYPIQNDWDTYAWPRGTPHAMVMGTDDSDIIHVVNLDTHAITPIRGLGGHGGFGFGLYGPGFTYADDSALIVQGPDEPFSGPPQAFFRVRLDSPTVLVPLSPPNVFLDGPVRDIMRLSPTTWFVAGKAGGYVVANVDSTAPEGGTPTTTLALIGNGTGTYISPRHDRATGTPDLSGSAGIPVLDLPSGNVAFHVPMDGGAYGADFSADGSFLAMTGSGSGRLIQLNASDGTVLQDTTFSANAYEVAYDPARPLVYVLTLTATQPGNPALSSEVLVLDRATFRVVGRLDAPQSYEATCNTNLRGALSVSRSANALYFFRGCYTHQSSAALRFTLPPDNGVQ
ncbi:MAG TPA: hypothetical protein VGM20_05400 [Gemmatimonadales bacterium]